MIRNALCCTAKASIVMKKLFIRKSISNREVSHSSQKNARPNQNSFSLLFRAFYVLSVFPQALIMQFLSICLLLKKHREMIQDKK